MGKVVSKLLAALAIALACLAGAVPVAAQMTIGGNVTISGNVSVLPGPSGNGPKFSLAGGTYTGAQTLIISGCGSKDILYRTDNGPVTIASKLYSTPLTVSTSETVGAICATLGRDATTGDLAYQTDAQANSASAVCYTLTAATYSGPPITTCGSSGGVTGTPANLAWTIAATAVASLTTQLNTSGGETQALFEHLFAGSADPAAGRCDPCTTEVQDFVVTANGGASTFSNIESDMPQYMPTVYSPVTTGLNRQNGLQCNQQTGGTGHGDWEVDAGCDVPRGWVDTGIACGYTAGVPKEVILRVTHTNGDTGCGGSGCANYTDLWDAGAHYAMGGNYSGTQGYCSQSGEKAWGNQLQPDLHSASGTAIHGTLTMTSDTVAMGYGDESTTTTANYVIH